MTRLLLAGVLLAAFGAGLLGGVLARRAREADAAAGAPARPPALEAAHRAWEGGDAEALAEALGRLEGDPPAQEAWRAEVALLRALAEGGEAPLERVAARYAGTGAAARARWILVERAPDPETRARRLAAFAAQHPEAWVLAPDGR